MANPLNIKFDTSIGAAKVAENYEGAIASGRYVSFPTDLTDAEEREDEVSLIVMFADSIGVEWMSADY